MSADGKTGPNYVAIAARSVVGLVVGGVGAFAAGMHGPVQMGVSGLVGFIVVFGAQVGVHAVADTKRLAAISTAKKKTEEAFAAQAVGKLDKAEKTLQEVLSLAQASIGERDLMTLATMHSLANVLRQQGKLDKAESLYSRALPLYEKLLDDKHPSVAQCHKDLALSLEGLGRHSEALTHAEKALALQKGAADPVEFAATRTLVARLYARLNQNAKAIEQYKQVLETLATVRSDTDNEVLSVKSTMARLYGQDKMYAEATEVLKELLMKINKSDNPNRQQEAEAFLELAEIRLSQNAVKDVEPLALTALKVLQNHVGPNDKLLSRAFESYRTGREKSGAGLKDNDLIVLFSSEEREKPRDVFKENLEWVNQKDKTGWSALQWASFLSREDLLKWLLRNGARPDNYDPANAMGPIHVAAAWGKMSGLEALLDAGVDINSPGPGGWAPIFYSAHLGREEITRQLVVRGADAGRADSAGRTPLHLAAQAGRLDVVSYLLGQGVDINATTQSGRTALHLAALNGHGPVVECLMLNKADLNITDAQGNSAARLAEQAGHGLLVRAMVPASAAGAE